MLVVPLVVYHGCTVFVAFKESWRLTADKSVAIVMVFVLANFLVCLGAVEAVYFFSNIASFSPMFAAALAGATLSYVSLYAHVIISAAIFVRLTEQSTLDGHSGPLVKPYDSRCENLRNSLR